MEQHRLHRAEGSASDAATVMGQAVGLSRVVADHPAAVLLVDLDSRQVIYANPLAGQLAPTVGLPVDVADWSRDAGLRDAAGDDLERGQGSLDRVASGAQVNGEQVTARRSSDVSEAREDLWVIGMPLSDAPPPLNRRALVVFLPLRDQAGIDQVQRSSFELQHRAVISSEVSFTISDPNAADDPLVWVNPAFEAITGYRAGDVLGTNCRFLQGPDTDPGAVQRIRDGLAAGGTVTETLLNYRANGTAFWNHIVISPIYDAHGTLTHHVGVQSDVTERVTGDAERDRALASAQNANERLAKLAAISSDLSNGLETGEATFAQLPAVIARHFDGWVLAAALTDAGRLTEIGVAQSARPADADAMAVALTRWATTPAARTMLRGLLNQLTDRAPVHGVATAQAVNGIAEVVQLDDVDLSGLIGSSAAITPITARGRHIGVLVLLRSPHREHFDAAELAAVADLGVRAGVGLDNARLYQQEHQAALTLQRSLLPRLPKLDGFDVAATYQPAHNQAEVGGDWYDVLNLPAESAIGVAIGDVMGHDLKAAAAMGQLRSVLRSYAWAGDQPSDVIARLDQLVRGLDMAALATCVYAVVRPDSSQTSQTTDADVDAEQTSCTVTYTLAGHPPPMIRHPDGRIELLREALTSPVGVPGDNRPVPQATTALPAGAHLVLYTDGLIERRTRDLDAGLTALADTIRDAPAHSTAEQLCAHIVTTLTNPEHDDDVCVLVLHRLP